MAIDVFNHRAKSNPIDTKEGTRPSDADTMPVAHDGLGIEQLAAMNLSDFRHLFGSLGGILCAPPHTPPGVEPQIFPDSYFSEHEALERVLHFKRGVDLLLDGLKAKSLPWALGEDKNLRTILFDLVHRTEPPQKLLQFAKECIERHIPLDTLGCALDALFGGRIVLDDCVELLRQKVSPCIMACVLGSFDASVLARFGIGRDATMLGPKVHISIEEFFWAASMIKSDSDRVVVLELIDGHRVLPRCPGINYSINKAEPVSLRKPDRPNTFENGGALSSILSSYLHAKIQQSQRLPNGLPPGASLNDFLEAVEFLAKNQNLLPAFAELWPRPDLNRLTLVLPPLTAEVKALSEFLEEFPNFARGHIKFVASRGRCVPVHGTKVFPFPARLLVNYRNGALRITEGTRSNTVASRGFVDSEDDLYVRQCTQNGPPLILESILKEKERLTQVLKNDLPQSLSDLGKLEDILVYLVRGYDAEFAHHRYLPSFLLQKASATKSAGLPHFFTRESARIGPAPHLGSVRPDIVQALQTRLADFEEQAHFLHHDHDGAFALFGVLQAELITRIDNIVAERSQHSGIPAAQGLVQWRSKIANCDSLLDLVIAGIEAAPILNKEWDLASIVRAAVIGVALEGEHISQRIGSRLSFGNEPDSYKLKSYLEFYYSVISAEIESPLAIHLKTRVGDRSEIMTRKALREIEKLFRIPTFQLELNRLLAQKRETPILNAEANVEILFHPTRSHLAVLSGFTCDTCWISQVNFLDLYPRLVFISFEIGIESLPSNATKTPFCGGSFVIPTFDDAGKKVLVVRGLNPHGEVVTYFDAGHIAERFLDYLERIGRRWGAVEILVPEDPRPGMTLTNRPEIFEHFSSQYYHKGPRVVLQSIEELSFNGMNIRESCIRVRTIR